MTLESDAKLKKNWFVVWKRHEEFSKLSSKHSKVSSLGLLWGPFIQSRECMNLKPTGELCVITMNNDAKFKKESNC